MDGFPAAIEPAAPAWTGRQRSGRPRRQALRRGRQLPAGDDL